MSRYAIYQCIHIGRAYHERAAVTTILYALRFSGDVTATLARCQVELFRAFGLVSALALPPLIRLLALPADPRRTEPSEHALDTIRRRYPATVRGEDFVVPSRRLVGARCDATAVANVRTALAEALAGTIESDRATPPQLVLAWEQHPAASRRAAASIGAAIPTTGALWLTRFVIHSDADDWARDCTWRVDYSRRLGRTRRATVA